MRGDRVVAREVENRARELFGRRDPLERVQIGDERLRRLGVVHRAVHRRVDGARQDRVDAQALRAVLGGQRLSQPDQPRLAGRVRGDAGERARVPDERRREDDRARASLEHCGNLVLGAEERAGQVRGQRIRPAGFRDAGRRPRFAEGAGVVERDVQPAEAVDGQVNERPREVLRSHVASERYRLAVQRGDLGDQAVELRLSPRCNDDHGALGCEQLGRCAADP